MSTDTPTPERVTLSDEEMRVLHDCFLRYSIVPGEWARLIAPDVETILAAREQALREEIAGEIEAEAHPFRALADPDGHRATLTAARIARGGAR